MKVAEDWLARYDRAAAVLPQPRRTELREELVEHLEALRAEGVGEEEIVSRLGDPAEIVAAEGVPALTPQRELAAKALFLLPLTGVLFLIPSMPPGLLTMTVLVLASVTTLVLVLRSGAGAGARVLGATGALAPPLAGLGGILDKVFQFRQTTHDLPLDGGRFHQVVWATDPWTTALGQFAMLLLGLGLPVLAGLRLRRPDTAPLPGLTAAALLLTPCVGLAAALMLSGAALDGPVNEVVRTPMLVVALVVAAVLLAAGALAAARPGLPTLTKVLVVAAVLCAPVGVSMLAQLDTRSNGTVRPASEVPQDPVERQRWAMANVDADRALAVPAGALAPTPFWVPADQTTRRGLGLLFVVVLPLLAAHRVRRAD